MSNRVLEFQAAYPNKRKKLIKHEAVDSNSSAMCFFSKQNVNNFNKGVIARQIIIYTPTEGQTA